MNVQLSKKNISFKKILTANANVISGKKPVAVKIYRLDKKEDKGYFDKLPNKDSWKNADLIDAVQEHFDTDTGDNIRKFYSMEDYWGNCLGVMESIDLPNRVNQINYLETCPEFAQKNKKRRIKYIGETMIAFATQMSSNRNDSSVKIRKPLTKSMPFYLDKCFFEKPVNKSSKMLILPNTKFDLLLEQNLRHTKNRMEYLG